MAQSTLLHRAKQGDADAIAALMNLTLQDKGVAAKVVRIQDYLHISFSAANALNQATLTEFARLGLERLAVESIQTVKVYGLKANQEQPNWVVTFQVGAAASSEVRSPLRSPFQFDRALLKPLHDSGSSLRASAKTILQSLQQTALAAPAKVQVLLSSARSRVRSSNLILPTPQEILPPGISIPLSLAIATGVTVAAFSVGGMVAGIAISHGEKSNKSGDRRASSPPAKLPSSPPAQTQVKQYLSKMIETQKVFYQQNLRLAKNLEELERSAAVVSHSYSYTYRVATATPTQFQLVAIAKAPDLKSYTAIATVKPIAEAPATIVTGLCETNQPAPVPPIVSLNSANEFQCPAGSSKVP